MTAIIDYGVGNLFSLQSSLKKIGEQAIITDNVANLEKADRIILPGVGAFADACDKLNKSGLVHELKKQIQNGKPILGICLGMQLLFDKSYEYGEHNGIGLIRGKIVPIGEYTQNLKIPHMGWNALDIRKKHSLFKYVKNGDYVYFVHSFYAAECNESILATSEYGIDITAAVADKNVMGCQFHPEKSGNTGLLILKAFCEMKEGAVC